ncbi:hypothetical protein LAZ67_2005380 [Cordylochernes scorpioides]|uniref:WD repeat domain-containing protein 83 n=1 Tax=Cordylochernes scorpioides TaxID=51811 RepID=A0ABY6K4I2_9ARAC|nr:hypothetical protein LAZ67_2005380 [Cordylochernes scorpioides]
MFQPIKKHHEIECKQSAVRAVRFNVDGNYCLTCGSDKSIKLWNPFRGVILQTYAGHGYEVLDVQASCDSSQIVSGGMDKHVFLWDVSKAQILRKFQGHIAQVNVVKFNEESTVVLSGSLDNSIRAWDCRSRAKEPIQIMKEAKDSVTSLQTSNYEILSASLDGHVRRYDMRKGELLDDNLGVSQESEAEVHASYVLSEMIAKHSKPFTEGDFIKECLIKAAEIVCPGSVKTFQAISLSRNTVVERVTDMARNLNDQIKEKSSCFEAFSIACDETCDTDFNIFEELLELVPMHGTTTGEDIFNCVYDLLQKYNLPQSKLTSVATDGAPSMTGKTNGFVALLRKKLSEISDGSNIHHTHCIIHQEVLCTKVIKMENVLTPIKKSINFIRSRGLNQRQFSLFLTELESEYSVLSYYTEVRWLSCSKVLKQFWDLKEEICQFLITKNQDITLFSDQVWLQDFSFMVDITKHLSDLNLKLQGKDQIITNMCDQVNAFKCKLVLWEKQLKNEDLMHFPTCNMYKSSLGETASYKKYAEKKLSLRNEFETSPNSPLPVFSSSANNPLYDESEDTTQKDIELDDSDSENYGEQECPKRFSQPKLNDLTHDLRLSKEDAELLASRLKGMSQLEDDVNITFYRTRESSLLPFYQQDANLVYCTNIKGLLHLLKLDEYLGLGCVSFTRDGQCILASCLDSSLKLLDKDTGQLLAEYEGHKNREYRMDSCLSHTDSHVISGSEDGRVYVWELVEGKLCHCLEHSGRRAVHSLSHHPSKPFLLTASESCFYLWTTEDYSGPEEDT